MKYEEDFYAWAMQTAQQLRQGQWSEIDVEKVAEELASMGRSERRELISRLAVLLAHLLKWAYELDKRLRNWECTIEEQRARVLEILEDSPSLKHESHEKLAKAYRLAVLQAEKETGITQFPNICSFSWEQILRENFYPSCHHQVT